MNVAKFLSLLLFILFVTPTLHAEVTDVDTDIPQPAPLARRADVTFDRNFKRCDDSNAHDPDAYCKEAIDSGLNSDLDGCKYVNGNHDTPVQDGNSCIVRCRYQDCPRLKKEIRKDLIELLRELEDIMESEERLHLQ